MAILVRRLYKVALFIGLFLLSVRYFPLSNESGQQWRASDWLGVRDPEDLYIGVWVTIELIVAVLAYMAIMKLWRYYWAKRTLDRRRVKPRPSGPFRGRKDSADASGVLPGR